MASALSLIYKSLTDFYFYFYRCAVIDSYIVRIVPMQALSAVVLGFNDVVPKLRRCKYSLSCGLDYLLT